MKQTLLQDDYDVTGPFDTDERTQLKLDNETPEAAKQTLSLDDLYTQIGFGKYQLRLIIILGLVAAGEGAQIISVPISLIIQEDLWGFSKELKSFAISINFLGFIIGGVIAGLFADRIGRLKPTLYAIGLATIINFLTVFTSGIGIFTFLRFFVGIFLGFIAPLGFTMVIENMPKEHRGRLVMIATSFLFVGQLFGCFVAWLFVGSLNKTGNWHALVYATTIFHALALVINYLLLDESIRYQLVMGKFDEAFKLLEKVIRYNSNPNIITLTEKDKDGLIRWQRSLAEEVKDEEIANVGALFKPEYRKTTIIMWFGYFVNSFVYFGAALYLPIILKKMSDDKVEEQNEDLAGLTLSVLVESLSVVIAIFVVDIKSLSRKVLLIIFYVITAITCIACTININRTYFFVWVTVVKIFSDICSYYFYLYTVEIYPTKYRTTGIGVASGVGKLATVAMPWACDFLIEYFFNTAPFGLFAALSVLAAVSIVGLPTDTTGKDLK